MPVENEAEVGEFITIPQPKGLNPSNTEGGRMLVTAAGTVLLTHVRSPNIWFYHPAGTYASAWRPLITPSPSTAKIGWTYELKGTQFNGLTQGAAFGGDAQSATNYPLVRIENNKTGHRFFARTHSFSTMAVANWQRNGKPRIRCADRNGNGRQHTRGHRQ